MENRARDFGPLTSLEDNFEPRLGSPMRNVPGPFLFVHVSHVVSEFDIIELLLNILLFSNYDQLFHILLLRIKIYITIEKKKIIEENNKVVLFRLNFYFINT